MPNITPFVPKEPLVKQPKKTRYSYSRLDKYTECGYRYKLVYEDKNYISEAGVAAAVGTLIHYIEESIANKIIAGEEIDYDALRKEMYEIDIPEKEPEYDADGNKKKGSEGGIYGVNRLQKMFQEEFFELDNNGTSYFTKCEEYRERGIYRLENYMKAHPELSIVAVEKEFTVEYKGNIIHGYIDRILFDSSTREYIIEDIKTKGKPFPEDKLKTPLQFVVYSLAVAKLYGLYGYPTRFNYDLPFCDMRQAAGTPGVMNRGFKKMDSIFAGIKAKDFVPHPSPLCHWCEFSPTNPNQPPKGKGLCPYYSLWSPGGSHKAWECDHKWEGNEAHEAIMEQFRVECGEPATPAQVVHDFDFSDEAEPPAEEKPKPAKKPKQPIGGRDPFGGLDF